MKNVWYNKNIINKIECCSVDNLQSLLSIIAAKMKSMIYQKPRFYVSTSKSIIKALINMHSFEIQLSPIG
ncbi:hypothetical protein AI3070V1_4959 (plasmid) [Klebsiella pneumoniae]|nr:hypothetical protein AI3070V1_1489 [Klebsiella pneumoniae]CAF9745424.1 hypothetical protein AI3070V1_4959 [Klebsiella pneumoniae]CAH6023363.1 hypothetical protein AI3070V1_1489 [Klebsiella pneumoniae]CAH6261481.1 hypothetical protein AI3070V1_4959 [Klebsiella pneumoniae]